MQGLEAALFLAEPWTEQIFEKGTITIKDSDTIKDTAYHIIKYWDKNPERYQKAKEHLKEGKLKIEGSIKFVTAIEEKLKN